MGEHRVHAQDSPDPQPELSNDAIVHLLNELISVCLDGFVGYSRCASGVDAGSLRDLFKYYATRRQHYVSDLASIVVALGGSPTALGNERYEDCEINQGWAHLKDYLAANDVPNVLGECEASEKLMKEVYQRILRQPLPSNIRNLVQTQYISFTGVKQQLNAVRRAYMN
jgi:uncharacterized protein (TIGR02284 family)